ncbi:unnamed protein product [Owenia fusiformis]|uniref:Uncharacterized protein n=1 Tax=Owenia fusiformis TaxID=6347 RepID=A0A8J1TT71_OWEFU|nr:unnamed protein product [Owenia fusiformis]
MKGVLSKCELGQITELIFFVFWISSLQYVHGQSQLYGGPLGVNGIPVFFPGAPYTPGCNNNGYLMQPNTRRDGGVEIGKLAFYTCKSICMGDPQCISVDWNQVNRACVVYTNLGTTRASVGYIHCVKTCLDSYVISPGAPRAGGPLEPPVYPGFPSQFPQSVYPGQVNIPGRGLVGGYRPDEFGTTPPNFVSGQLLKARTTTPPLAVPHIQGHKVLGPRPIPGDLLSPLIKIQDDGICPGAKFQRYEYSNLDGAFALVENVGEEECKKVCLDDSKCLAADFNVIYRECFIHNGTAVLDLTTFSPGSAGDCCVHFRKLECDRFQCYEHPPADITDADCVRISGNTTIPGLKAVDCGTSCFVTVVINNTSPGQSPMIARGCEQSEKVSYKMCQRFTGPPGSGSNITGAYCRCKTDRCNALSQTMIINCLAHFPLDSDGLDSFKIRSGKTVNIKYDCTDKAKNCSAKFGGKSYIEVRSFTGLRFGPLNAASALPDALPRMTIVMWFKRITPVGEMALINNGPTDQATFLLTNMNEGREIRASVKLNGTLYTVSTPVTEYFDWNFLAFIVDADMNQTATLYLNDQIDPSSGNMPISVALPNATLPVGVHPLMIGAQYLDPYGYYKGRFFRGNLDEVMLFNAALSEKELQAIFDLTKKAP